MNESDKQALKIIEKMHTAKSLIEGFEDVADDVVVSDWTKGEEVHGKTALMEKIIGPSDTAFKDEKFDINHMFASNGMVVLDAVYSARFVSDYKGIPAHGRRVSWKMRDMFLVNNKKIIRMWYASDTLEMLTSLGAVDYTLQD